MNNLQKTKVVEELENPKVGWESTAEDEDRKSTNDLEQSIYSPTETDFSSTQQIEVASPPNPLLESECIENHAKATASPGKDVTEECTLKSAASLLRNDEPDITFETVDSKTVVTISNVGTHLESEDSENHTKPTASPRKDGPEECTLDSATSSSLKNDEPDLTSETTESKTVVTISNVGTLLDSEDSENHAKPTASPRKDGSEECTLDSATSSSLKNDEPDLTSVTTDSKTVVTISNVGTQPFNSEKTDLSVQENNAAEPLVAHSALTEPSDTVTLLETNPEVESKNPVTADPLIVMSDTKLHSVEQSTLFLCDDPISGPKNVESATPHCDSELTSKEINPDQFTNDFLPKVNETSSEAMVRELCVAAAVGETPNDDIAPAEGHKEAVVSQDNDITTEGVVPCIEKCDVLAIDIPSSKQLSDSEIKSIDVDKGDHFLEPLDTSTLAKRETLLPKDHTHSQASELKHDFPETKDKKEPELSDTSADVGPLAREPDEKVDGGSTPEKQNDRLPKSKQRAHSYDQQKVDGSTTPKQKTESPSSSQTINSHDHEISKLNINQLKKYYKWFNLGLSPSDALSNAKQPGLKPQTEDPHPDCKLSAEEIKLISSLIPAKYAGYKFQIETFFGGKDPEATFKDMMESTNTERHPNCHHSWGDLQKMSNKLSNMSVKYKFLVETYFRGKEPKKVLETISENVKPPNSDIASTSTSSTTSVDVQVSSLKDELISESDISELSLNQRKKFYKWRILGVPCSEALVKAKEPGLVPPTEDPHPDCKFPFQEIKQMSLLLPPKTARNMFLVETFFGGKDPEEQLKLLFAKAKTERHADCQHTWEELKKMAEALPKVSFQLKFVVDSFYGGMSPAVLLKSMLSPDPLKADSARDVHFVDGTVEKTADGALVKSKKIVRFADSTSVDSSLGTSGSQDDHNEIEEGPIGTLCNGKLKLYYLRRNAGFDHDIAFSKASKFEGYSGLQIPNSKLSQTELKKMSQSLSDTILRDRFFIHTYFGGKDPNRTMEYIKFGPRNTQPPKAVRRPDDVVKPVSFIRNSSTELHQLQNGSLKLYFLWRNNGCNHETALSNVRVRKTFPGKCHPHSNCMHSEDELRYLSQALESDLLRWDRFIVYTYYGGKDPRVTLQYFMEHPESCDPPEEIFEGVMDKHFLLLEETFTNNKKLKKYYAFFNNQVPHEAALSKAVVGDEIGDFSHIRHPNCWYTEAQLRDMSQVLQSKQQSGYPNFYWDRFVIHTFHGGKDPQSTLKYFVDIVGKLPNPDNKLSKRAKKRLKQKLAQESQVKDVNPQPVHVGPVANRTSAVIPLDSPNHPSNLLKGIQLKNYYLWMHHGLSQKQALVNAQKPGCTPPQAKKGRKSRCYLSMPELRNMARKLPTEELRETFIMETYFAGNIPEEVMEHLLSIARNDGKLQQSSSKKYPPYMGGGKAEDGVQFANQALQESYFSTTISVEEEILYNLTNGELKYYYLWRNEGLGQEQALLNVRDKLKIPGIHRPHPDCKYSEAQLEQMTAALKSSFCRQRVLVHAYFGGKDPERAIRHFIDDYSPSAQAHQANFPSPTVMSPNSHPPGLPPVQHPRQHPAVGLPHVMPTQFPMDQHLASGVPRPAIHPMAHPHGPPVYMAYPSDQHPSVNVHTGPPLPHQQLVPQFGKTEYPSNLQGAGPPLIHQPHGSRVYSEYDSAIVYPSGYPSKVQFPPAVQQLPSHQQPLVPQPAHSLQQLIPAPHLPPPRQQPPVSQRPSNSPTNIIHSARATAHQTPRAERPLVGIHDPKQSSLKRKPTDEFPIKITLKSSADQPKPHKLRKEETTPTDKSVPMFIVPTSYPNQSLSDSQMDAIESNLLEAILEMDDDGTKPSFKDTCRSNGRFGITCVEQFSVNWLHKYLKTYQPWPGASLKLIGDQPAGIRANARLPPCKMDDNKKILKYIERQNKCLNVNKWTVIQRWDNGDCNTCIELIIDEKSAEVLKKCSTINFKLGSADIIISKNDDPLTSSLNPTKSPGTSSQSQPPPPLKKSVPRSSLSEQTSTSHGWGRNIPKGTSARSESPVQHTKPSSGEKHSWMDWFYSKRASSAASSQDNPFPSRETYHSSKEERPQSRSSPSPKYRRESDWSRSRSPSPKYHSRDYSPDSYRKPKRSRSRSPSPKYHSRDYSPDSYRKPKKQRRASLSPSSSSDEYSSTQRSGADSRQFKTFQKPSWL